MLEDCQSNKLELFLQKTSVALGGILLRFLIIDDEKARNVKLIFDLYLSGQSILGIIKELGRRKLLSPTRKEKWCKRTIDVMLSNEKYTGDVKILKSGKSEIYYLASDNIKRSFRGGTD